MSYLAPYLAAIGVLIVWAILWLVFPLWGLWFLPLAFGCAGAAFVICRDELKWRAIAGPEKPAVRPGDEETPAHHFPKPEGTSEERLAKIKSVFPGFPTPKRKQ